MKKNKEILIATSNNGKIKEFENLLAEYKVVSLKDYDIEDFVDDEGGDKRILYIMPRTATDVF